MRGVEVKIFRMPSERMLNDEDEVDHTLGRINI